MLMAVIKLTIVAHEADLPIILKIGPRIGPGLKEECQLILELLFRGCNCYFQNK